MEIEMYTDRDVAKMFHLSAKWGYVTIQKMAQRGKIKGVKVGDKWRFSRQAIEDLLSGNRRR